MKKLFVALTLLMVTSASSAMPADPLTPMLGGRYANAPFSAAPAVVLTGLLVAAVVMDKEQPCDNLPIKTVTSSDGYSYSVAGCDQ